MRGQNPQFYFLPANLCPALDVVDSRAERQNLLQMATLRAIESRPVSHLNQIQTAKRFEPRCPGVLAFSS